MRIIKVIKIHDDNKVSKVSILIKLIIYKVSKIHENNEIIKVVKIDEDNKVNKVF